MELTECKSLANSMSLEGRIGYVISKFLLALVMSSKNREIGLDQVKL